MGCAHIFDWIIQSTDHQQTALQRFPKAAELAQYAQGKTDFIDLQAQLSEDERAQYHGEQTEWYAVYGQPWDEVGCLPETKVGEHTHQGESVGALGFVSAWLDDVKTIQSALAARGYNVNADGHWAGSTCAACYKLKRERLNDYSSQLSWDFFADLGFSQDASHDYADQFKDACVAWYDEQIAPMMDDLIGVQEALYNYGFNPGSTNGLMDVKTCTALKAFQHQKTGSSSDVISADTFYELGFHMDYAVLLSQTYGSMCAAAAGDLGAFINTPTPTRTAVAQDVSDPMTQAAIDAANAESIAVTRPKFSIVPIVVFVGGLIGVAIYLAGGKRKK